MMIRVKKRITREETVKYSKIENSTFYKLAREEKILIGKVVL